MMHCYHYIAFRTRTTKWLPLCPLPSGQVVYVSPHYIVLPVPAAQADEKRKPYLKQARTAGINGALAPLRLCELAGYLHDRGPDKAKAQKLFQEALGAGAPPSCACELLSK